MKYCRIIFKIYFLNEILNYRLTFETMVKGDIVCIIAFNDVLVDDIIVGWRKCRSIVLRSVLSFVGNKYQL